MHQVEPLTTQRISHQSVALQRSAAQFTATGTTLKLPRGIFTATTFWAQPGEWPKEWRESFTPRCRAGYLLTEKWNDKALQRPRSEHATELEQQKRQEREQLAHHHQALEQVKVHVKFRHSSFSFMQRCKLQSGILQTRTSSDFHLCHQG